MLIDTAPRLDKADDVDFTSPTSMKCRKNEKICVLRVVGWDRYALFAQMLDIYIMYVYL